MSWNWRRVLGSSAWACIWALPLGSKAAGGNTGPSRKSLAMSQRNANQETVNSPQGRDETNLEASCPFLYAVATPIDRPPNSEVVPCLGQFRDVSEVVPCWRSGIIKCTHSTGQDRLVTPLRKLLSARDRAAVWPAYSDV